jgi:hypothetical protein
MPKPIDLRKHKKIQIADRYIIKSKVLVRYGSKTGGWVRIRNLSGQIVTILKINKKSLTVALRSGPRVSVFTIVTKGPFKVLPIIAEKVRD